MQGHPLTFAGDWRGEFTKQSPCIDETYSLLREATMHKNKSITSIIGRAMKEKNWAI